MLKIISAKAITTNMDVNIFIADLFVRPKNTKKSSYINKPLTLLANNLTAIAKRTTPKTMIQIQEWNGKSFTRFLQTT